MLQDATTSSRVSLWAGLLVGCLLMIQLPAAAVTLVHEVRCAVVTNPEVLASLANKQARRHAIGEAKGQLFPQIFARAAGGRERTNSPATRALGAGSVTLNRSELSVTARQLVFDGFGVVNQVHQRNYQYRSAAYQYCDVKDSVILAVAEAYLNVLRQREIVQQAKDNVAVHAETLRKVRLRFQGGASRRSDVELGVSRWARAQAQLVTTQGNLMEAVNRYLAVTGHKPLLRLVEPRRDVRYLPRSLNHGIKIALNWNPTVQAAKAETCASAANVGVTRSRFFPRLDLEASVAENDNLDGIPGPNREAFGLAVVNYDIFNGGSDVAAVRSAKADYRRAVRLSEDVKRQVVERVRNAWANMITGRRQAGRYRVNVAAAAKVVIDYKKQFELGQRQLFNVLDSENDLFIARTNLTNARFDNAIGYYRVLESIGHLSLHQIVKMSRGYPPNCCFPDYVKKMERHTHQGLPHPHVLSKKCCGPARQQAMQTPIAASKMAALKTRKIANASTKNRGVQLRKAMKLTNKATRVKPLAHRLRFSHQVIKPHKMVRPIKTVKTSATVQHPRYRKALQKQGNRLKVVQHDTRQPRRHPINQKMNTQRMQSKPQRHLTTRRESSKTMAQRPLQRPHALPHPKFRAREKIAQTAPRASRKSFQAKAKPVQPSTVKIKSFKANPPVVATKILSSKAKSLHADHTNPSEKIKRF